MESPVDTAPIPLDLVALGCILLGTLIANIVYALTGFGNAILFLVFWQIWFTLLGREEANDLVQVVVLNFLMGVISVLPLLWITRKDIQWQPLIWVGIPNFAGTVLGNYLLFTTHPAFAKQILGIVFLIFSVWKVLCEVFALQSVRQHPFFGPDKTFGKLVGLCFPLPSLPPSTTPSPIQQDGIHQILEEQNASDSPKESREPDRRDLAYWLSTDCAPISLSHKIGSLVAGFASGLLRGMFGAGGPPLMVYVQLVSMSKEHVRALSNTLGVLTAPLSFFLLSNSGGFSFARWPSYLVTIVGAISGLFIGARLFQYVDTHTIMRGILILLVLASVVMLNPPLAVTLATIVILSGIVLAYIIWRLRGYFLQSSELIIPSSPATADGTTSTDSEEDELYLHVVSEQDIILQS